jgi:hypothetical protein
MSDKQQIERLATEVAALRQEVTLLQDERAVRRLHHSYGYYMDKWLFPEIVDLFADDATLYFLNGIYRGRGGAHRMYHYAGENVRGPRDGLLFEHILAQDVIDVAPDGLTAKGRFHAIMFVAVHQSVRHEYPDWPAQFWEGGIHENEYRKVNGVWQIQVFNYRISYQADYATGWAFAPDKPLMVRPYEGIYPARRTSAQSVHDSKSSLTVFWVEGSIKSAASSASGSRTNRRSAKRG